MTLAMPIGHRSINVPTEDQIRQLETMVAEVPSGATPAAWYLSPAPDVIKAYEKFKADYKAWSDRMAELAKTAHLSADRFSYSGLMSDTLVGLIAPSSMTTPPRWWRFDKEGRLVPRRKTKEEKKSQANKLWEKCRDIPSAVSYLPGMSNALWMDNAVYVPQVRSGDKAKVVCVYLFADPDRAKEPFAVGPQWTRMKVSTFNLLRERQEARKVRAGG